MEKEHDMAIVCDYNNRIELPPLIQPLVGAYLDGLKPLSSSIYGIYVFGSIALKAFEEEESDIDILVLAHREWTHAERKQLSVLHTQLKQRYALGSRLEVLYIPLHNLGKCNGEVAPYPHFHRGRFFAAGYADLNSITWWSIKNRSICLSGPERSQLAFEITRQDILQAMYDNLNGYWMHYAKHFYLFLLDGWVMIAVTMLCRILTTIEEGEIIAKSTALTHWRDRLPDRWRLLIDEAWRIRHHLQPLSFYPSRLKRMRDALLFIGYVRKRGNAMLKTTSLRKDRVSIKGI